MVLSRFQNGDNMGVFPYWWEVLRKEGRVKYRDEEGYSSLWKVLQSPVQNIFMARRLVDLGTMVPSDLPMPPQPGFRRISS